MVALLIALLYLGVGYITAQRGMKRAIDDNVFNADEFAFAGLLWIFTALTWPLWWIAAVVYLACRHVGTLVMRR